MTDDTIGTITGTATFEAVEILKQSDTKVRVVGSYMGDTTTYETERSRVRLFGNKFDYLEHSFAIRPEGDDEWIEVEATEDRLLIGTK